jgi:Tfp pilus assembly protein PilX
MKGYKNRQKGIGLIEVLLAAVVFALGSLAVVQLQGKFFKNSSASNARSVAMSIAQEKLEDLRGVASTTGGFVTIAANAGGRLCVAGVDLPDTGVGCTAGVLSRPTGNVTKNNAIYTRTWAVANSYYDTAGTLLSQASCTTSSICGPSNTSVPATPDQKNITVTIAWTDTDGSAQTVVFDGLINANSTSSGGTILADTGGSGESPSVPYTPNTDDRVTPISVGTDTKRETLVPVSSTVDGYTRTLFTAYTYNDSNVLIRQEDFQNVACDCRFDGTSTAAAQTYAAAHLEWDTTKDTYVDSEGELLTGKVKGCVKGGGSNCAANPEPLCEVCCRDHHDSASAVSKYDPYRSSNDFTSGNHNHYNGTNVVTSGQYLESCRMKRVNGYWRAFQDWNLVKLKALPLTDLTNSATKLEYATYVNAVIDAHLDESNVTGQALTTSPTVPSSLVHTTADNYIAMNVGDRSVLSGRAIYLDYIDGTHLTAVKNKKTANEDYLLHVPFYEISVGEVAKWNSNAVTNVKVGYYDGPGSANDLVSGELNALATSSAPVTITALLRKSNSGLTNLTQAIDYNATTNADNVQYNDSLAVCVGCTSGTASCATPWGATISHGATASAFQTASVVSPASCVSETRSCSNGTLSGSYTNASCAVISSNDCTTPWGATVSDGGSVTAYQNATPSVACASETRSCASGSLSGSYQYSSCVVTPATCTTSVTGFANSKNDLLTINDGASSYNCTVANNKGYSCPIVTTSVNGAITVTSTGTVNLTSSVTPICGAKTVNF